MGIESRPGHLETLVWHAASELPDSDRSVLVCAPGCDEPVWIGFHDGEKWVSDGLVEYAVPVTAWADLPEGPSNG